VQWKGVEPAESGAVKVPDFPGATVTSKAPPLSAVTVWAEVSAFLTVTFVPGATLDGPEYLKSLIVMVAVFAESEPPAAEDDGVDGAADDEGADGAAEDEVADPDEDGVSEDEDEHAARPERPSRAAAANAAIRGVGVMRCPFLDGWSGA